jgi:methylated-DNA-protein-cysteine methyltransferase-like protein
MARSPANARLTGEILSRMREVPAGRVTTLDVLADDAGVAPAFIARLLATLSEDERQSVPWHRVVAKGGAIGHGPHRDAQFARLVREGVPVSPAGIVQDMARVVVSSFGEHQLGGGRHGEAEKPPQAGGRSRGMKDRP